MSNLYMYDDVTVALIPATAEYIAYYTDGRYANLNEVKGRFPNAKLVSIAVFPQDDADALDVEPGDAAIADIYGWLKRQLARGVWRPVIYTSVNNVDRMMETMNANGFQRSEYRIWSAHYGAGDHICGPDTCKLTREQCDWTQFTNRADNSSLDESDLGSDVPVFVKPDPYPVLREGMTDPVGGVNAVHTLQTRLNAWAAIGANARVTADGDFGVLTEAAVKSFQAYHRRLVTGVVEPQNWADLNETPTAPVPPAPVPIPVDPKPPVVNPVLVKIQSDLQAVLKEIEAALA